MTATDAPLLPVADVFASGPYVVPIYQRAYAWGEDEILTLLRDVRDYRQRNAESSYYIGSLVTYERRDREGSGTAYEVVDGQQRLTTLYITLAALSASHGLASDLAGSLVFQGRDRSTADLTLLARKGAGIPASALQESGIRVGFEAVRRAWETNDFEQADLDYLLQNTWIVLTTLPAHTDLNHYFEVMNSRGEQLEKHEIVKAALMGTLQGLDDGGAASRTFARIWDACSDMGRHVQSSFSADERTALFGADWNTPTFASFAEVARTLSGDGASNSGTVRLSDLIKGDVTSGTSKIDETDATERYGAILDLPNFLLHVLALTVRGESRFTWESPTPVTVALDDKRLVVTFKEVLTSPELVTKFGFTLLRARYLFDRYVIKTDRARESDEDPGWVLRQVSKTSDPSKLSPTTTFGATDTEQDHVVLLQSMFQVTDSRRAYKNFLYATLEYLYDQPHPVEAKALAQFLAQLAQDRYVHRPGDLDKGTSVSHFAFNYLDYLLWRRFRNGEHDLAGADISLPEATFTSYRFRYRTSVEHFYPRNPDESSTIKRLPPEVVDLFGNLCLMTRSENSRRSNLAPQAKIVQYRSDRQSLKFQVMAAITKADTWDEHPIEVHGVGMQNLLEEGLGGVAEP